MGPTQRQHADHNLLSPAAHTCLAWRPQAPRAPPASPNISGSQRPLASSRSKIPPSGKRCFREGFPGREPPRALLAQIHELSSSPTPVG